MDNIAEIIEKCESNKVRLTLVDDSKLRAFLPKGHVMPVEIKDMIRHNKPDIVRYLSEVRADKNIENVVVNVDPWSCVKGLRLLPEDKAYLQGFFAGRKLDKQGEHELLKSYSRQWRIANNKNFNGRYAANRWLSEKA